MDASRSGGRIVEKMDFIERRVSTWNVLTWEQY